MQLSVFDDASTVSVFLHTNKRRRYLPKLTLTVCSPQDDSMAVVEGWRDKLEARGILLVMSGHNSAQPRGG